MKNKLSFNKTTKDQFELFKKECEFWINYFGLKGWCVEYAHKKVDARGQALWCIEGRIVTITLSTYWDEERYSVITTENIKMVAFHEVCEVMLSRLRMMAKGLISNHDGVVDEEVHNIIRILENTSFKNAI